MKFKSLSSSDSLQERLKRFNVRHITDPEEIARIQAESNYRHPKTIEPRFIPNPENWDFF
jgi:hypothetical protein